MPREEELTKKQIQEQIYKSLQEERIDKTAHANPVAVNKLNEISQENIRVKKVDDATFDPNVQGSRRVQMEVDLISEALTLDAKNKDIMLSPKTKERLKVNKGRKTSQLLLNSTRKYAWWDSEEMTEIKDNLKELEDFLAEDHSWESDNETVVPKVTDNDLRAIELKYNKAIYACRQYLAVKTTKTGTGRYTLVRDKMLSLMEELSEFTSMRTVIATQSDAEWTGVRTYADLLWSFNIHKYAERLAGKEPVSEKIKNNNIQEKQVIHNINKDALDPGGKLIFNLLCLDSEQSLTGADEDILDNVRLANYVMNILDDMKDGAKAFYLHSGFAGYKGDGVARKYKDNRNKTKTCNTVFELVHMRNGKLVVSVNGSDAIELPGIEKIIADIRNKIVMSEGALNHLHEVNPDKYEANLGNKATKIVMKFAHDADYKNNEAPTGFRENAITVIRTRYDGIDPSRFDKIKNEDLRKLLDKALYENIEPDRMLRAIAILNNEKHWTDEVYADNDFRAEDINDNDADLVNRIKTNALEYLGKVTYMSEKMFDQMSVKELHALAKQLMNRETNPEKVKGDIRSARGGKYYVEVKGDAGKYINSKDARDVLKKWKNGGNEQNIVRFMEQEVVREANPEGLTWSEEEKQIKTLISNLIFSEDSGAVDETVEQAVKGARFKKIVNTPESIHTIALMLKNEALLKSTLERIPFIDNPDSFSKQILMVIKSWLVLEANEIDANSTVDQIEAMISERIEENITAVDIQAEDKLDKIIEGFASNQIASIQNVIDEMLQSNFGGAMQLPAKPDSSKEPGVARAEKAERVKQERAWLTEYLKQNTTTGNEGQAKFLKEVLGHYFGNISSMDQRSVIAFMIREAKRTPRPDERLEISDKDNTPATELAIKRAKESCLAGMFKGAGPLLQKTLQGIPTEGIPGLLKFAIEDMRSKLLPISREYVEAQLHELVASSNGKITKIEITKSLGAASVGQAFLVKVYGPNMDGVNHVVKILRPDATYRMEREKAIFEQCAKSVDGENNNAMQVTFKNTYQRINQELNFENEVANALKGKRHYDTTIAGSENDDYVHSMNVSNLTKSSKNVMLIEVAKGKTVDQDTTDIENMLYDTMDPVYSFTDSKKFNGIGGDTGMPIFFKNVIEKISPLLAKTQKKQKYLVALAEKWLYESVFSAEGFYHGDLHAGNIMIDENGVTVIDYGNATVLSKKQQENLIMLVASAGGGLGVADKFIAAFEALLYEDNIDEHIRERFENKREEFGEKVREILDMGDDSDAVLRMSVIAAEAQKLGFPMPTAIANYLQCQNRFKNTIEAYNKLITDMQTALRDAEDRLESDSYEKCYSMKLLAENFIVSARDDADVETRKKYTQRVLAKWYATQNDLSLMLDDTSEEGQKAFADIFIGEDMDEIKAKLQELRAAQNSEEPKDAEAIKRLKDELIAAINEDFNRTVKMDSATLKSFNNHWGADTEGDVTCPFAFFREELGLYDPDREVPYRLLNGAYCLADLDRSTKQPNYKIIEKVVTEKNDAKLSKEYAVLKDWMEKYIEHRADEEFGTKNDPAFFASYKRVLCELIRVEMSDIKNIRRTEVNRTEYSGDEPETYMNACGGVVIDNKAKLIKLLGILNSGQITMAMVNQAKRLGYELNLFG